MPLSCSSLRFRSIVSSSCLLKGKQNVRFSSVLKAVSRILKVFHFNVSQSRQSASRLESEILEVLSSIIDPDLEQNIVDAGFIKNLTISDSNDVSFTVELTTPACPIKAEFERSCKEVVTNLEWVQSVNVTMSASEKPVVESSGRPDGLKDVSHVLAVYSCKGGAFKFPAMFEKSFQVLENQRWP